MHPVEDIELLREYTQSGSEEAFATLVSRHVNMVYSVALRTVGNPDHAQEIAQAVFLVFARKARSLGPRTVVGGWLFHAARLTAFNFVRNEVRRRRREQEVYMQSQHDENDAEDAWAQIAPMLDGAIGSLGASDRNAVVLRFLEGREMREVGLAIGASEEAAKKRVHRALEKLRKFFTKRGIMISGSLLASAIAANSASAAPTGLATSITAVGALKGATVGASTLALMQGTLKIMAWAKLKVAAAIGAGVAFATGTVIVAVTYAGEASHDRNEVVTLSSDSPFVRHLSNPPWIKKMLLARGYYAYGLQGVVISNGFAQPGPPSWTVSTQTVALQPSGMYTEAISTAGRFASGVDDQVYWTAVDWQRSVLVTPVTPGATVGPTAVDGWRPRIEEIRHLGLPALQPGTFAMQGNGKFTAVTLKGDTLDGRILKVSNDRPLSLVYNFLGPAGIVTTEVTITYRYASDTAPLPASIGHTEKQQARRRSNNGPDTIVNSDLSDSTSTNWIFTADYGLDPSVTNGYSPSRFFPDVAQYRFRTNWISNGITYIDGVARPAMSPPAGVGGGRGTVTNQANK